jgi:hypothetical protein
MSLSPLTSNASPVMSNETYGNSSYASYTKQLVFHMIHFHDAKTIRVTCSEYVDGPVKFEQTFKAELDSGKIMAEFMQDSIKKCWPFMQTGSLQSWTYQKLPIAQVSEPFDTPGVTLAKAQTPPPSKDGLSILPEIVDSVVENLNSPIAVPPNSPQSESSDEESFQCTAETFYDYFSPIFEKFLSRVSENIAPDVMHPLDLTV